VEGCPGGGSGPAVTAAWCTCAIYVCVRLCARIVCGCDWFTCMRMDAWLFWIRYRPLNCMPPCHASCTCLSSASNATSCASTVLQWLGSAFCQHAAPSGMALRAATRACCCSNRCAVHAQYGRRNQPLGLVGWMWPRAAHSLAGVAHRHCSLLHNPCTMITLPQGRRTSNVQGSNVQGHDCMHAAQCTLPLALATTSRRKHQEGWRRAATSDSQ
jgi:hypothetical protein